MLNYCLLNLAVQINNVVVDWSAVGMGAFYFLIAVAVIFTVLVLATSILRFQHIIGDAKQTEEYNSDEGFVIRLAGRIASLRNRPPPFALLVMSARRISESSPEGDDPIDMEHLAESVRSLLRGSDDFSVSSGGEAVFLIEASREDIGAVQSRIAPQINQMALKDSSGETFKPDIRFGCAHFPNSGDSVEKLFNAARVALARADEAGSEGCWEFEPPLEEKPSAGDSDQTSKKSDSLPAYIDPVTGLLKPARSRSTAQKFLSQFRGEGDSASIIIIRIDGIDRLCRDYGDGAVDPIRSEISHVLQHQLRDDDLIACWGEDGFIVGIEGDSQAAASVARRVLGNMRQQKVAYENYRIRYSVSIGVSTYPQNARLPRDILNRAELAQREARDMGRNIFAVFEPKMLKRESEARKGVSY